MAVRRAIAGPCPITEANPATAFSRPPNSSPTVDVSALARILMFASISAKNCDSWNIRSNWRKGRATSLRALADRPA